MRTPTNAEYGELREKFVASHPIKDELERLGVKLIGSDDEKKARCPFHDDKNPSFSVNLADGAWKCWAGCGSGGVVELVARHEGKTPEFILEQYGQSIAHNSNNGNGHHEPAKIQPPLNWTQCVEDFGEAHKKRLAEYRGYSSKFVDWLVENRMVGVCEGRLAFPIYAGGKVVGTHQKAGEKWIIRGKQSPWVIGDHFENVLIFESQWDAFALMDATNWSNGQAAMTCSIVITRGAANGKSVQNLFPTRGKIYCWTQNDTPDERGNIASEKWLTDILSVVPTLHVCRPPKEFKDVNDWVRGGGTQNDLVEVMSSAATYRDPSLPPVKAPLDLLKAMKFDPENDPDCLMGRRYLCRGGSAIWVGSSGVGKSVMSIQAAITFALGLPLFGLEAKRPLRSVIVSAEDDFGDISETIQGVARGMGAEVGSKMFDTIIENVLVFPDSCPKGLEAVGYFEQLVLENKADLLWVNPLLSYFTGNPNDAKEVGEFCGALTNMQVKTGVCTMLIHHTGKPGDGKTRENWSIEDYSYVGLGSSVWTNWARAIVAIQGLKEPKGTFVMRFAKRGQRTGIVNEDFERIREIYIEHGSVGLVWKASDFCPNEDETKAKGRPTKASWPKVCEHWDGSDKSGAEMKALFRGILSVSDKTASRILSAWAGKHIRLNSKDLWVKIEDDGQKGQKGQN